MGECLDNICSNTQTFYSMINRMWNNLYTFYISERYTKDLESQNKNFKNLIGNIQAMFKINSAFTTFANGKSISCNGVLDLDLNQLNKLQMVTILSQPAYYGQFNYIGKDAEKFIDSEFSIYRQTLPPGSFQKLNEESRKNSGSTKYTNDDDNKIKSDLFTKLLTGSPTGFRHKNKQFDEKKEYYYRSKITFGGKPYYIEPPKKQNKTLIYAYGKPQDKKYLEKLAKNAKFNKKGFAVIDLTNKDGTPGTPGSAAVAAADAAANKALDDLAKSLAGKLTPEQLAKLKAGKLTPEEMKKLGITLTPEQQKALDDANKAKAAAAGGAAGGGANAAADAAAKKKLDDLAKSL